MDRSDLWFLQCLFVLVVVSSHGLCAPFTWTSIDVDIELQETGDLLISETQTYTFEAGDGDPSSTRARWLPVDRLDDIRDVNVYELARDGEVYSEPWKLPVRVNWEETRFIIKWSHDVRPPETRTFLIEYRVVGGLHVAQPNDTLRWEAIASDRPAPIGTARIRVLLPKALHGKARRITSSGASASLDIASDESAIEFNPLPPILANAGLEVLVTFPHGILKVKRPSWQPHRSLWERVKAKKPPKGIVIALCLFFLFTLFIDFNRRRCPECGKFWGLKMTGEKDNLNAGKFYWFLTDYEYEYKCKRCGYEEWKKNPGGGC